MKKRRKHTPIFTVIVADILMAGVFTCTFAMFHHVIPMMKAKFEDRRPVVQVVATPTPSPVSTPFVTVEPTAAVTAPAEAQSGQTPAPEVTPEPTPEPTPESVDTRTEWQKKFADHFTDEVIVTPTSYSSPNISVSWERFEGQYEGTNRIWYIADIYVGSLESIRSYTKNNTLYSGWDGLTDIAELDMQSNAVMSINADDYSIQVGKPFVRNGVLQAGHFDGSICVLYNDGTMQTFRNRDYDHNNFDTSNVWQLWSFGPPLLDAEGRAYDDNGLNLPDQSIEGDAPRTVIGYYEPGHYCFIVNEGRFNDSKGLRTAQLAKLCESLGLMQAYNLDGGRSATMIYNHEQLNRRSNGGSNIADIICIVEPDNIVPGPVA